jgi:hypothetical protein
MLDKGRGFFGLGTIKEIKMLHLRFINNLHYDNKEKV